MKWVLRHNTPAVTHEEERLCESSLGIDAASVTGATKRIAWEGSGIMRINTWH
jgi:hypothetical protein